MSRGSWFELQKSIIDYSVQALFRRWSKNLLIVIVFVFLVFSVSSILFVVGSLTKEMMLTSNDLPDITVQKIIGGRQTNIQASYIPELEKIPGVEAVEPRVWGYFYLSSLRANFTIYGMDLDQLTTKDYKQIVDWKPFPPGEAKNPAFRMIVGQGVYNLLKRIGMEKTYLFYKPKWGKPIPFDIIGTFTTASQLQSNDLMVLQTEGARRVLELPPGEFTDLAVYVPNPSEVQTIAFKIHSYFPDLRTVTKEQIKRTYRSAFGWRSAFVLSSLLVAVLAFLIMLWDKATGLSPEERREIGILKALGWDTHLVLSAKMWEALIMAGISTLTGILAAYGYVYWLRAPGLRQIFIGWSTIYPPFKLIPRVDPKLLILIVIFSVVPYVAVTIIPSWKAASTDPDVIIRNV